MLSAQETTLNEVVLDKYLIAESTGIEITPGAYRGCVNSQYLDDELLEALASIRERLQTEDADLIAGGRNKNYSLELPFKNSSLTVLVKEFGQQSKLKDWLDLRFRDSKAQRSFAAALHLYSNAVGTPAPIAFLEQRAGNRLRESYYISVYEKDCVGFREVLIEMLQSRPSTSELMPLLMNVALLCREMHDAGFIHHDLGNQNILLQRDGLTDWQKAKVIDLNRGRLYPELSEKQRVQDLSRLNLPGGLMEMFLDMYLGMPATKELKRWYQKYRARFQLHERSRKWRHPIREARVAKLEAQIPEQEKYPALKDVWVWDDFSDQALSATSRKEKKGLYPANRGRRMVLDVLKAGPSIWRHYHRIKSSAFSQPVDLASRLGVALEPAAATLDTELALLATLGPVPVIIRSYHHQDREQTSFQIELIKTLAAGGHAVTLALVQDRDALLNPESWHEFVMSVLEETHEHISGLEFGHAINRVKWGVWDFHELQKFYRPLEEIKNKHPGLEIIGPATIDFEYAFLLSALKTWPKTVPLSSVSHHLYVDRRGAPENTQGGFNTIDKCVLASAIAAESGIASDKIVISEVNWPISGTEKYSPVTWPFDHRIATDAEYEELGVDEALYADYMIRYLALTLCSGLVEKIYWWRLVAKGYGLADLLEGDQVVTRPALQALRQFLLVLGNARFIGAEIPAQKDERHGRYLFWFEREDGEQLALCWNHGSEGSMPSHVEFAYAENTLGERVAEPLTSISGSPAYLRQCTLLR